MGTKPLINEVENFTNFAGILNLINDDIAIISRNHRILFENSLCVNLHGNNLGKECFKIYANQNNICPGCPSCKVFEHGEKAVSEKKSFDLNGHEHWVEIVASPLKNNKGEVVASLEIARDLTKRKNLEESLRKNKAQLEAIIENSPCGITISDFNGKIIRTNPAHQKIFGYSQAELESMTFSDFTHPEDIGKNSELFKKLLVSEMPQLDMTKRFIHKDGRTIWSHVRLSLLPDEKNRPLFVIGIVEDITERKKDEMVKNALIEKLQKASEEIKSLQGIIPICMHCKQIRDDKGFWHRVETYIEKHSEAAFSHGICPGCFNEFHPDVVKKRKK